MAREARATRWPWFLPVEHHYATSVLEVQRDWSLDDLLAVLDRVNWLRDEAEKRERQRGRK